MAKKVIVYGQPDGLICVQVKEYLSRKQIQFYGRDITKDPSAILQLRKLGFMTTPVTVVDDKVILGLDVPKLDEALN